MGQAVRRRRGAAMRMAQGPVRPVLADRPGRAEGHASGPGQGPGEPGHAGADDHGQDRHCPPAASPCGKPGRSNNKEEQTMTSETSPSSDRELVLTRLIDAPREAVFRAWTDPDLLKRW